MYPANKSQKFGLLYRIYRYILYKPVSSLPQCLNSTFWFSSSSAVMNDDAARKTAIKLWMS